MVKAQEGIFITQGIQTAIRDASLLRKRSIKKVNKVSQSAT